VSRYGGKVAILALTHPHQDHYPGFVDLIDRYDDAFFIGCVHPNDSGMPGTLPIDAMAALKEGAKPAYTRIWDEWTINPTRRWNTFRGENRPVGEATVPALHPAQPVNRNHWGRDPNAISSAMLVEWGNLRLLLGADVPHSEWPGISAAFPGLSKHAALKVPHHGSREAIHQSFGEGDDGRFWVITPFRKQRLPRAEDRASNGEPEGLHQALSFVSEVRLTSLPFRHESESEDPCFATRGDIRDRIHPLRTPMGVENDASGAAVLDRQIVVAFDRNGSVVNEWYGRGTVRVRR
jgi:hypothetical protein